MAEGPPSTRVNNDDHGALLAMSAWFLGCTLVLSTVTRIGVRLCRGLLLTADDICILIATALAIGGTIAVSFAVESGLGKRRSLLNPQDILNIERDMYITTLLYILTLGASKLSVTIFLGRLACTSINKAAVILLGVLVVCGAVSLAAAKAFECELPRPWDYSGKCIRVLPFWMAATAIDIVTDIIMILLPIHIVSGLQLQPRKKAIVMFIFTLRILLIFLSITHIIFFKHTMSSTVDLSFDGIPFYILSQTHAALSVIIACSPALKPFMDNVRTGMLSASLSKHGARSTFGNSQALLRTTSRTKLNKSTNKTKVNSKNDNTRPSDKKHIYVSDERGRIIAISVVDSTHSTADTAIQSELDSSRFPCSSTNSSINSSTSSTLTSTSTSRTTRPPRPPPPPEELRPDLTIFGPRCLLGHTTTAVTSEDVKKKRRTLSGERKIEARDGYASGGIKQTTTWDVRFDDAAALVETV